MIETIKDMLTRRSIRKFKPEIPPQETIDSIIEAGLYAASGKNTQLTKIIAVTNRELRDRISESNRVIGGYAEGFDPFYGAPVILIVVAAKEWRNRVYDGSLVMGNLMLAAHALGIASCWIHRAKEEFETEEYAGLLRDLGIEGEWEGIGHCALGYADQEPKILPRKENRVYYVK
ncbi:MAG: nitroreductase [Bacteroidales bacterium]|nr:nitroreductase [Bacteroidales bacterium]